MIRQLPVIVGVVAIVALTVVQSLMSDRFVDTNVTAEQRAELLKLVPPNVGEWEGKDLTVEEEVRATAGAVGCVSRQFKNSRTGEVARLWLIVGHARDIANHTPDICYKGAGFSMRSSISSLYPFEYDGQSGQKERADFWTNTFTKEDAFSGRRLERVFWSWYKPKPNSPIVWQAEKNPRLIFGNSRALFKMYFASEMRGLNEATEDSSAAKFGKEFLPVIERILTQFDVQESGQKPATNNSTPAESTTAAPAE